MKKNLTALSVAVLGLVASGGTQAYSISFGEDINNSSTLPLATAPNSAAAQVGFLSGLSGESIENFESLAPNPVAVPLTLSFAGSAGANLSATLSGGDGRVFSQPAGTAAAGRYSVPSENSTNFWRVDARSPSAGNFMLRFDTDVAAFGFYGIDVGDFGGLVSLDLLDVNDKVLKTLTVPHTDGSLDRTGDGIPDSTDGSVLFYGLVAENLNELFRSVRFNTTFGTGDIFAFDNFTIADSCQAGLCAPPSPIPVPEPATLALSGLALLFLSAARRRRA